MAKVKIVYGSGGGNTEMVCEKVMEVLAAKGCEVEIIKAKVADVSALKGSGAGAGEAGGGDDGADAKKIPGEKMAGDGGAGGAGDDFFIMAAPTYGHGEMETYMAQFMAKCDKAIADGELSLAGRKCAVIALGDPKYEDDYHIETAMLLSNWLKAYGAEIEGLPLRVSKSPVPHLDGYIKMWAEKLGDKLGASAGAGSEGKSVDAGASAGAGSEGKSVDASASADASAGEAAAESK